MLTVLLGQPSSRGYASRLHLRALEFNILVRTKSCTTPDPSLLHQALHVPLEAEYSEVSPTSSTAGSHQPQNYRGYLSFPISRLGRKGQGRGVPWMRLA